jgi:hypothetical protein
MRSLAAEAGRTLRFGIRLHVISRDRSRDAWAETERFLESLDPKLVQGTQKAFARSQSVGQQRMASLHNGSADSLVVSPNLWAGYGLVRGGAGTALVGSHEEVADRIEDTTSSVSRSSSSRPPSPRGGVLVRRRRRAHPPPTRLAASGARSPDRRYVSTAADLTATGSVTQWATGPRVGGIGYPLAGAAPSAVCPSCRNRGRASAGWTPRMEHLVVVGRS